MPDLILYVVQSTTTSTSTEPQERTLEILWALVEVLRLRRYGLFALLCPRMYTYGEVRVFDENQQSGNMLQHGENFEKKQRLIKKKILKWNITIKLCFIVFLLNREGLTKTRAFSMHGLPRKSCRRRNTSLLSLTHDSSTPIQAIESIAESFEGNAKVEAEILNDLAHIVSDYLTALAPTTYLLRLLLVLGRLLGLTSGYVSENTVLPDELFLQTVPLALLSILLFKSVVPMARSLLITTDESDKKAYDLLFAPVGVSWAQFKTLKVSALDWIEVLPGTVLVGEEDPIAKPISNSVDQENPVPEIMGHQNSEGQFPPLFWLYKGDVVFSLKGTSVTYTDRSEAKSINDPSSAGLLADMRVLYTLDSQNMQIQVQQPVHALKYFFKGGNSSISTILEASSVDYLMATVTAGDNGASLLRINSEKLHELLELDDQLRNSFRTLILTSLQRQASNLLKNLAANVDEKHERELDSNFGLEVEE